MRALLILAFLAQSFAVLPAKAKVENGSTGKESPAPAAKAFHFDHGKWAIAHWTAAAFDYSTTGMAIHNCQDVAGAMNCFEGNQAARLFLGKTPSDARLAAGWVLESGLVSLIPNKTLRRFVQVGAIAGHVYFGARNVSRWR